MINIDFTNIDNSKLIGRLLPFWARGKKISLFLQAILSPIIYVHTKFQKWALEVYIESHITAQKPSLEWYLKYKLKSHFVDDTENFQIDQNLNQSLSCFSGGLWYNNILWNNDLLWENEKIIDVPEDSYQDYLNQIVIYAPAIIDTMNYDEEDYKRDIRNILSKFMVNFRKIKIIVREQTTNNIE